MKFVRGTIGTLVCLVALLFAISVASVDSWGLVIIAAFVVALIVPDQWIKKTSFLWSILIVVELWRISHISVLRGWDFVLQGDVFFITLAAANLLLATRNSRMVRMCMWLVSLAVIFFCLCTLSVWERTRGGQAAYLERGQWGITHTDEKTLDIRSQYSYSIIKKCLNAECIQGLDDVYKYSSLWIITPTRPFDDNEIQEIEQWVKGGGRLVVVSDHTDLFGHAEVLNELLRPYDIWVGKDCVINDAHSDVAYFSVAGWFGGLTGNTIHGKCFPFLLEIGYREMADYSGRSFFSDNAVTDEDRWGIYCAGAYRSYGRGKVTVFSDSTLLADFALSRPSSQLVLRMLRDGLFVLNLPAVLFLLCLCYVSLNIKTRLQALITFASLFMLVVYVVYFSHCWIRFVSYPLLDGKNCMNVTGNWDVVDMSGSNYSAIFAACYASGVGTPVWSSIPTHSGTVLCNGQPLFDCNCDDEIIGADAIESALTNSMKSSKMSYIRSLVINSRLDGIWFDAGVGIFKEYAYNDFWLSMCGRKAKCPELGNPQKLLVNGSMNGSLIGEMAVDVVEVLGPEGWVVVGDWVIGRRVNNEILIRKKWQHPKRQFGDVVLTPILHQQGE